MTTLKEFTDSKLYIKFASYTGIIILGSGLITKNPWYMFIGILIIGLQIMKCDPKRKQLPEEPELPGEPREPGEPEIPGEKAKGQWRN